MSVIDASVYVALLNNNDSEHGRSVRWMLNIRAAGEKVYAPNILLAEVCAAFSRVTGDSAKATAVLNRLRSSTVITLLPVTRTLAVRSAAIALHCRIRGCDAIYVAVAEQVGHPLVTLDRQQRERAKAVVEAREPTG